VSSPVASDYLIPFDGSFRIGNTPTAALEDAGKKVHQKELRRLVRRLGDLQGRLYAQNEWAVLLIFQAMDAAGKDSTIRALLTGVNPAGCQVSSFQQPSAEELDHDFLWRTTRRLPERGRIGVFNRSYYEEVLVVRVHPEYLRGQRLPRLPVAGDLGALWQQRYESIRQHERHLAENGTTILKFWLNVSREEQKRRFLKRIDTPEKNWKFAPSDIRERARWDDYMQAYEEALAATSRPWAPWFAIPADDKPAMRRAVADIVVGSLESLDLAYPDLGPAARAELEAMREDLA
jgi:PPK2 family polyphosphate:nucleotide phosphotransferase